MLTRDLAHALDPAALFETAIGSPPDPWQAVLLRSAAQRVILNVCRQGGKSITAAVIAYYEAVYRPPALVLLISPSLRQSGELFRKCLDVHRIAGGNVPVEAESTMRLELRNGSRAGPRRGEQRTNQGFSNVRLIVADEAPRIADAPSYHVPPLFGVR